MDVENPSEPSNSQTTRSLSLTTTRPRRGRQVSMSAAPGQNNHLPLRRVSPHHRPAIPFPDAPSRFTLNLNAILLADGLEAVRPSWLVFDWRRRETRCFPHELGSADSIITELASWP